MSWAWGKNKVNVLDEKWPGWIISCEWQGGLKEMRLDWLLSRRERKNPGMAAWYAPTKCMTQFSSVAQPCPSLWLHEPQHARPPCPSPTPGVHPNPCPSSWSCHPAISSSVVPFCSCPQSFPASGSFPMSQLFASGGQSTGVSASTSVLPMNTQDWSPLGWTGWISLQSRDSQESSPTPQFKSMTRDVFVVIMLRWGAQQSSRLGKTNQEFWLGHMRVSHLNWVVALPNMWGSVCIEIIYISKCPYINIYLRKQRS